MSTAAWFLSDLAPSRHTIENEMRLAFWNAGFKQMWFTCTKDQPPFEVNGQWHSKNFAVAFEPKKSLALKMKDADQELLSAFERVLGHRALAAYRDNGSVVVEWRVKEAQMRFEELQKSGAKELERLSG